MSLGRQTPQNMEEEIEDLDSQNQEEAVEAEPGLPADPIEDEPQDKIGSDDSEALKASLMREQALYEQLKKAKGFKRDPKTGKWTKPEPQARVDQSSSDITIMELKSLLAANISDDSDTEEVRLYARAHKTSITEALKMPEVKSLLKTRIEMRKTAEATNTSSVRRGQVMSQADMLDNARKGNAPQDTDGVNNLVKAAIAEMKAKTTRS